MKNYWEARRTTKLEYYLCYAKELDLQLYRPSSISWTIHSDYMEKFGSKPFVRTLVKVRFVTSSEEMQIIASGLPIPKSMQSLSKRVTILPPRGRWNYNSYFTLNNWGWPYQISQYFVPHLLRINRESSKKWKKPHSNKLNNLKQKLNKLKDSITLRSWVLWQKLKLTSLVSKILWLHLMNAWLRFKIFILTLNINLLKL